MFTNSEHIRKLLEAGNCTLTLKSNVTQKHYTYRIRRAKNKENCPIYFVSLLTGCDNESSYSYIGIYSSETKAFRLTDKSKMNPDSIPVKAFMFLLKNLNNEEIPDSLSIYHEGRCAKCNRKLTTPESIRTGFGPVCESVM